MASTSSIMKDATTQTDVTTTPPAPLPDQEPVFASSAAERPPRNERRRIFWHPIHQKMVGQREKREHTQAQIRVCGANGPSQSHTQGCVLRDGRVKSTDCRTSHHGRNGGGHANDRANGRHGPSFSITHRTPQRPRHDLLPHHFGPGRDRYTGYGMTASRLQLPVPMPRSSSHAFLHNLRDSACFGTLSEFGSLNPTATDRQQAGSQSSATHVGDGVGPPCASLPLVVVTPSDACGQSARPVPDAAEIGHNVLGMGPPTPMIPSVRDDHIDAELGLAIEPLQLLMPDPGSSNCAPTTQTDEWDGKTQVADSPEQSRSGDIIVGGLPSSRALVEIMFKDMKEPVQTPDRSWTFPGRERSSYPPASLDLEDARTLVDEPQELLPKADPAYRGFIRTVKSVENFFFSEDVDFRAAL
ncbi:hypothetical protein CC86DRAFT_371611, partial [Ophiobolus disseminans]